MSWLDIVPRGHSDRPEEKTQKLIVTNVDVPDNIRTG